MSELNVGELMEKIGYLTASVNHLANVNERLRDDLLKHMKDEEQIVLNHASRLVKLEQYQNTQRGYIAGAAAVAALVASVLTFIIQIIVK